MKYTIAWDIAKELRRSTFVSASIKPGYNKCEIHRTTSLMRHTHIFIVQIPMNVQSSRI